MFIPEMLSKKDAVENFDRKTTVLESLFNKVADPQQATPAQVFSHELCEVFKNTFIEEQLQKVFL